jgi:hypothetical protein
VGWLRAGDEIAQRRAVRSRAQDACEVAGRWGGIPNGRLRVDSPPHESEGAQVLFADVAGRWCIIRWAARRRGGS